MIVKMFDKEWEVKNPTYKEKRELWKMNSVAFSGDDINQDKYFDLLEKVEEISGLNYNDYKDSKGKDLDMIQIDALLQQIFLHYLGLSKKE